jgi:DNA-binding NarL/FixJ family response regulator
LTDVIDIAAVDDHPIILDSVVGWVRADQGDIRVIATSATVDALLAGPGRHVHVVLLDLDLGDGTTPEGERCRHPARLGPRFRCCRHPTGVYRRPSGRRYTPGRAATR